MLFDRTGPQWCLPAPRHCATQPAQPGLIETGNECAETGQTLLTCHPSLTPVFGRQNDAVAGTLWGADDASDQLIVVDKETGVGSAVGALGFDGVQGLAFHAGAGVLYGTDGSVLYTIDTGTGRAVAAVCASRVAGIGRFGKDSGGRFARHHFRSPVRR